MGCVSGLLRRQGVKKVQESSKIARPAGGAAKQAAVCDWGGQQSHTQYNTTHDERASVYDLLPTGAEYAISRRQLIQITGLADRKLRRKIAEERKAGLLILSSAALSGGGYYRPSNTQELRRWVAMMTAHVNATLAVIRAAQEAIAASEVSE